MDLMGNFFPPPLPEHARKKEENVPFLRVRELESAEDTYNQGVSEVG